MENYNLQPDESVIVEQMRVKYGGSSASKFVDLTLTNLNIISVEKSAFGKVKNVLYFPLNQIQIGDGKPNVAATKVALWEYDLEIFFQTGMISFGFSGDKKKAERFVACINGLYTGEHVDVNDDAFKDGFDKFGEFIDRRFDTQKATESNKDTNNNSTSIVGKVMGYVAAPLSAPIELLGNAEKALDKKLTENRKKLFTKDFGTELLVIDTRIEDYIDSHLESYDVYDENQNKKYRVEDGSPSYDKRYMSIYNVNGKMIANVRQKSSRRYDIIFSKKGIGEVIGFFSSTIKYKVKRRSNLGKQRFKVAFNGWHIEGNALGTKYTVYSGNSIIAVISKIAGSYSLSFISSQHELILLMLVIIISTTRVVKTSGVAIVE